MRQHQLSLFEQFTLSRPDLSDGQVVQALCEQLLDEGEVQPPANVELLASLCGIVDIEYRADGPAGILIRKSDRLVASVRIGDGLERQRFTVLHEGGHTLLPGFPRGRHYRCKGPRTREEQLCDIAAAELLLPRRFFIGDLEAADDGFDGVEELAERYLASRTATALRMVDLSPDSRLLLTFQVAHKPAERGREATCEPRLRLAWAHRSQAWPHPRRHKSVSDDSPFARAWAGEQIDETGRVGDVLAQNPGPVRIQARRYGDQVLALIERVRRPAAVAAR